MGQILERKKRGRPRKADPAAREPPEAAADREIRRSHRRRNVKHMLDLDDYFDDDGELFENDEDHRRKQKKLKLLLKLDQARAKSASSSMEDDDDDDEEDKPTKKRKIDYEQIHNEEVTETKPHSKPEEDSQPGTLAESPSGVQLPDKKDLELILNKLQKKDIYAVYAEPVDPEELPDYHELIKHPMDFATVRSKLGKGSYATLEQFERDVFLICSNAMQYNTPDTIYHKQARSIQELAKKKFSKIRMNMERSEKEMNPEHKMRSNSILKKQIKRPMSRLVQEPLGSDFSSGATLATPIDIQNVTNALLAVGYERPGSIEGLVEGSSFLNNNNLDKGEESLSGRGSLSGLGRKSFIHDEDSRATYSISLAHPVGNSESILSTFEEESKLLVPVGLYSDHSYARSLASFAATLGPVAWKVASKRIEQALPEGFQYGRGWVGEYEPLPTPVLMLGNCTMKKPDFFAKVQSDANPRKPEKIPMVAGFSKDRPCLGPCLETNLPFIGAAGIRPPSAPIITSSVPVKEQPIRGNTSEVNPSYFLSTGIKPRGPAILNYQHQNSQSRTSTESDNKNVMKQVELTGFSSFSKDAANSNGIAGRELASRKVSGNRLDNNPIAISFSDSAKVASCYPHEQGQGLTDPAQLMRMLAQKAQSQEKTSNQSAAGTNQVFSLPPFSGSIGSNNAAAAAARVWMSVGAGGFRPAGEDTNLQKNQIFADSRYNSTHNSQPQVSQFRGEFPASRMLVQPNRGNSPIEAFVPQGAEHMRVRNEIHFQNQQMDFPQLVTSNLSKLQVPPTWRNLNPQMDSRQKPESFPPDLNIGRQSSESPRRSSLGVLVDSQQPDLALQL